MSNPVEVHCKPEADTRQNKLQSQSQPRRMSHNTHAGLVHSQRLEPFVEAVGKNDSLQNLFFLTFNRFLFA